MIIVRWCFVDRASDLRDINVDYFLSIGVENWAEVERVTVLAIIDMWAVVH